MSLPETPRTPGRLLIAGALIVVGMVILVPSGLCSSMMFLILAANLIKNPATFLRGVSDIWPFGIAILGAVLVGIVLLRAGMSIGRPK